MKNILPLFIILFCLKSFSQTDKINDCDKGKAKALKDFNNGKLLCRSNNHFEFNSVDGKFEHFFETYIYSKHSIFVEDGTYLTSKKEICYTQKMDSLIFEKFGENIYKISRKEAKDIYVNTPYAERSKIIDLNKTYFTTNHSSPKFIGNDQDLCKLFKTRFNANGKHDGNIINLYININGVVFDYDTKDILKDSNNKAEIITEINALGRFVPGYLYNIKVNSKTWYWY